MNSFQHELDVVSDALAKVSRQLSIWQLPVLIPKASEHQFGGLWGNCGFAWRGGVEGQQPNNSLYSHSLRDHYSLKMCTQIPQYTSRYFSHYLFFSFGNSFVKYNSHAIQFITIPVFIENLLDPMYRSVLSLILFSPVLLGTMIT